MRRDVASTADEDDDDDGDVASASSSSSSSAPLASVLSCLARVRPRDAMPKLFSLLGKQRRAEESVIHLALWLIPEELLRDVAFGTAAWSQVLATRRTQTVLDRKPRAGLARPRFRFCFWLSGNESALGNPRGNFLLVCVRHLLQLPACQSSNGPSHSASTVALCFLTSNLRGPSCPVAPP